MMNALSFSDFQSTATKLFGAYASLTASMMLVRTVARELIPNPFRSYLLSAASSLFNPLSNHVTIVIDELAGMSRNQVYDAAAAYLRTRIGPETRRLDLAKTPKQSKFDLTIAKGQEISDVYKSVKLRWRLGSVEPPSAPGSKMGPVPVGLVRTYFELSFNKKFRELVLDDYLPYVFRRVEEMKENDRVLKLYTMNFYLPKGGDFSDGGHGPWGCINLDHPATFDTIAMEPEMRRAIVEDLERFVRRKDYYKKVGRAWKRGYLLYGPPGTGKSSLVAAMANYLKFDIYDLELTMMHSDAELRRILVSTTNRSIVVIEDIDCSLETAERKQARRPTDFGDRARLSLSGLLNFIDGLWSSCGDERIIVFTTNHKNRIDPALLRPGRMDMHIHMSYCTKIGFKILALNYLGVNEHDQPHLFSEIGGLIDCVEATPAEIAEELMRNEDPAFALRGVVGLLKRKRDEGSNGVGDKDDTIPDGSDSLEKKKSFKQGKKMKSFKEEKILNSQDSLPNGQRNGFKTTSMDSK